MCCAVARCVAPRSEFGGAAIHTLCDLEVCEIGQVDQLLSPADVAVRCGLSRRAVYRAIEAGDLLASRLCHRLRIRPADVDAWIERSRVACERPSLSPSLPSVERRGLRRLLAEE